MLPAELPKPLDTLIPDFAHALKQEFEAELVSVIVYGAVARGSYDDGSSDINLLIVVESFSPRIYKVIAEKLRALRKKVAIDPLVVSRDSLKRTVHCFALKFMSIDRHHIVVEGADVLQDIADDPAHLRFLVEQELRNLRLRSLRAYLLTSHDDKRFTTMGLRFYTKAMLAFSNVLRVEGIALPESFEERLAVFEKHFQVPIAALQKMQSVKARANEAGVRLVSEDLLALVENIHLVLRWLTKRWELMT